MFFFPKIVSNYYFKQFRNHLEISLYCNVQRYAIQSESHKFTSKIYFFISAQKKSWLLFLSSQDFWFGVRLKGLEPSRLATLDPKSSASTNSATSAYDVGAKVQHFLGFTARIL